MTHTDYDSDPQKGQWGGHAARNGRELSATIRPHEEDGEDWYQIALLVRSTDSTAPLTGTVRFHLHPTFATPVEVDVDEHGEAHLELLAWGSFTVGAEADEGRTKLELDLAEIPDAPEQFKLM